MVGTSSGSYGVTTAASQTRLRLILMGLILCLGVAPASAKEPTLKQIQAAQRVIRRAAKLYGQEKFDEAGDVVSKLTKQIKTWTIPSDEDVAKQYTKMRRSLQRARRALASKGVTTAGQQTRPQVKSPERPEQPDASPMEGDSQVSFSAHLAPILVARCLECHGPDDRSAGFSVETFRQLSRGGNRGAPLADGAAGASLLIQKLRGTADGDRMPPDEPLDEAEITLFAKWIDQGASNDIGNDRTPLSEVANKLRLAQASSAEISEERRKKAEKHWSLAFPSRQPSFSETEHYLVVGMDSADQLAKVGEQSEQVTTKIMGQLKLSGVSFMPKGRITVFVVPRLFDLNEFSVMVEGRRLTRPIPDAYWTVAGADAYVVAKITDDSKLESPLPRVLTGVILDSRGGYPEWFVNGLADAMSMRLSPRHPVNSQITNSRRLIASLEKPTDFLRERTSVDVVRVAGLSFVTHLRQRDRQFLNILQTVNRNEDFASAVENVYGEKLKDLAAAWWNREKNGRAK